MLHDLTSLSPQLLALAVGIVTSELNCNKLLRLSSDFFLNGNLPSPTAKYIVGFYGYFSCPIYTLTPL